MRIDASFLGIERGRPVRDNMSYVFAFAPSSQRAVFYQVDHERREVTRELFDFLPAASRSASPPRPREARPQPPLQPAPQPQLQAQPVAADGAPNAPAPEPNGCPASPAPLIR